MKVVGGVGAMCGLLRQGLMMHTACTPDLGQVVWQHTAMDAKLVADLA